MDEEKRKRTKKNWTLENISNLNMAIMKGYRNYPTSRGCTTIYMCSITDCNFEIKEVEVFFENKKLYYIYQKIHKCSEDEMLKNKMKDRQRVFDLIKVGVTSPSTILDMIKNENKNTEIVLSSVNNIKYKNNLSPQLKTYSLDDITEPVFKLKNEKNDSILILNEAPFTLFISTKKVLKKCSDLYFYHLDFTYKCLYPNFPVLVFGASDFNRKFHIVAYVICEKETIESVS